jgi:hypothetical protein
MNKWKMIVSILTAALIIIMCNKYCGRHNKPDCITADTSFAVKTKVTSSRNLFTAGQVGNIKRMLIDSLKHVFNNTYQTISKSSYPVLKELDDLKRSSADTGVYTSIIDSNFIAKDSSGFITDSTYVKSVFVSHEKLPANCVHLLTVEQKSFTRQKEITRTITNREIIEKQRGFFERFKIVPNVSAGVGLITKTFDIYAGVGFCFEL